MGSGGQGVVVHNLDPLRAQVCRFLNSPVFRYVSCRLVLPFFLTCYRVLLAKLCPTDK